MMLVKTKKLLAFFSEENKTSLKKTVIHPQCVDEKLVTMCIKLSQYSQGRQAPACRNTSHALGREVFCLFVGLFCLFVVVR